MKLDILYNMVKGMVKCLPFYLFAFSPLSISAQTFTQRVQQQVQGEGTVTIHHDAAIDELVNGPAEPKTKKTTVTPAKPVQKKQQETPAPKKETPAPATKDAQQDEKTPVTENVSTTPKRTYKTTGYRVQAFAGGNTRNDRRRAEQTGNTLRQLFPGEEVYVHFYSPRWICRMGNYLTYQEAYDKMMEVRKMGYESATVVKGKITVTR